MHKAGDVAFAIVIVAGILVLTRPNSIAPAFIQSIGGAFSGAIQSATTGRAPGGVTRRRR